MNISISKVRNLIGLVIITVLFLGCAATSSLRTFDPVHLQSSHQTELVLVTHSPISYYWNTGVTDIGGYYSTSNYEITRKRIKQWGITYRKTQRKELDLIEPYYAELQDPIPITQDLYFNTLQKVLEMHNTNYLQLSQYSGTIGVNEFEKVERPDNYLPYNIPTNNDSVKTDWYMVLEVKDIGMVKTGVKTSSASLFDAMWDAVATALTKKNWFALFSVEITVVDANSKVILWKSIKSVSIPIEGTLPELVADKKHLFPQSLVEAIAEAATISALSFINNQTVGLNESNIEYLPKSEELEPYAARLLK